MREAIVSENEGCEKQAKNGKDRNPELYLCFLCIYIYIYEIMNYEIIFIIYYNLK